MTNTKHTPGPWAVNKSDTCLIMVSKAISPGVTQHIADVQYNKERYANAHLIAAAPAMYEALKEWCDYYAAYNPIRDKRIEPFIKLTRQALAQAEGK